MSLTTDLPKFRPDLIGEDPGDECYIDLTPDDPQPSTRMIFCWCPPAPKKKLPGFWLGKHLVTQAQWQALMGQNPSYFKGSDLQPVDYVSWDDAGDFAQRSQETKGLLPPGFELWLPTETQWKHACLAGRRGVEFGIGAGRALNSQMANFDGNAPAGEGRSSFDWLFRGKTMPVGCFPPNAWGLHDMHGQLLEWCADWYDKNRDHRVQCSGSWFDYGSSTAASIRDWDASRNRVRDFGLRVSPCSIQIRAEGPQK